MDATLELKNGFCEMTQDELRVTDGGIVWLPIIGLVMVIVGTAFFAYDITTR